MPTQRLPPILEHKHHAEPAVFLPENLLREARRQRRLPTLAVPEVCILDPDGDIVRALRADGRGQPFPGWACYHTEMLTFELAGERVGIVGCAVGASFAVLVAEQMFASGCRLLISLTSAGRIAPELPEQAFFVLIDKALRDEGTSYHYLPPDDRFAHAEPGLVELAAGVGSDRSADLTWRGLDDRCAVPRNRTGHRRAAKDNVLAVEMEAAALYAFAQARQAPVVCLAHVTNRMAQIEGDFEKGEADGSTDALRALSGVLLAWRGTA